MSDPKPDELLGKPITANYEPEALTGHYLYNSRMPAFSAAYVPRMLADHRIQFGIRMLTGPILAASRFYIDDPESSPGRNSEIKEYAIKSITNFWRTSVTKALQSISYGYSGHESMFKVEDDLIYFDTLLLRKPHHTRVVTSSGEKVGITVSNVPGRKGKVYLGGPKGFWTIHDREIHPWYGRSRLYGAFQPWLELHGDGGARDTRRLYYHKHAFTGEIGYYPVTASPGTGEGPQRATTNKEIMRSILEKRKAGAPAYFPNITNEQGNRMWEISPATAGPGSTDILQYHQDLRREIFEGMGIPNEVVEAAETGSGFSGRRVPQTAFFSSLQDIVNWLIYDFDQQILRPCIRMNFGREARYSIVPFGLLKDDPNDGEKDEAALPQAPPTSEDAADQQQFSLALVI